MVIERGVAHVSAGVRPVDGDAGDRRRRGGRRSGGGRQRERESTTGADRRSGERRGGGDQDDAARAGGVFGAERRLLRSPGVRARAGDVHPQWRRTQQRRAAARAFQGNRTERVPVQHAICSACRRCDRRQRRRRACAATRIARCRPAAWETAYCGDETGMVCSFDAQTHASDRGNGGRCPARLRSRAALIPNILRVARRR